LPEQALTPFECRENLFGRKHQGLCIK